MGEDTNKKAALAAVLLGNTVMSPTMKATLESLLSIEKNDEVKFRLSKTLENAK